MWPDARNHLSIIRSVLLAILTAMVLAACGGPDSAAKDLLENLKAGKHLAVTESLSRDTKQLASLVGGVSDRSLKPHYRTGQIKAYSLNVIETTSTASRYAVVVTTADGKSYKDIIDVTKEDGSWKISKF